MYTNDYNPICVTDDIITSDTQVFLQTKFTSSTDSLQLGYFMILRLNENLNTLATTLFKDTLSFAGKMLVVDFMLLVTRFTSEVDIDQDGLQFTTDCNIFNRTRYAVYTVYSVYNIHNYIYIYMYVCMYIIMYINIITHVTRLRIVHTSNFSNLVTQTLFKMTDRCATFMDCGTTIPL